MTPHITQPKLSSTQNLKTWTYLYSNVLNMRFAVHDSGKVMTEDKTTYSTHEIKLLSRGKKSCDIGSCDILNKKLHMIKHVLGCEIVAVVEEGEDIKEMIKRKNKYYEEVEGANKNN